MEVKHLTLDVWNTIFKSNPAYSKARAEIISIHFLGDTHSPEQISLVRSTFKKVKKVSNAFEMLGASVPPFFRDYMVCSELGISYDKIHTYAWQGLMSELALEHPPFLVSEEIPAILNTFMGEGRKVNIVSNTSFIKGATIIEILNKVYNVMGTPKIRCMFSDELPHCKPSPVIYANLNNLIGKVSYGEHLFFGDDEINDVLSPEAAGISAMKCEGPSSWTQLKQKLWKP